MYFSSADFRSAAQDLLDLSEKQIQGEISEEQLIREYRRFKSISRIYFADLKSQMKLD